MPTIVTESYSDHDMQCPASWENGFKESLVISFGDGERVASDPWTGEWAGSTFRLVLSDHTRRFRQQLASTVDRYWTLPLTVRMTTRANRAALGMPYTVFVGPIVDVRPTRDLTIELTLGDIVSQGMLSDQHQIPWRIIRDGFIPELSVVSESLDLESPEPIVYGQHRRVPDVDPASPQGFQWTPIYLGEEGAYHLWMVCGHACADIPEVLVWTPDPDIAGLGTSASVLADGDWLIPHTSAPAYEDRHSYTYGNDRRYTLIRGLVGNEDADACALGEKTLTCFVDGVEPIGDGTDAVITDRIQQYKHFLINFVANRGQNSYQSGAWLANPTWTVFDTTVPIVEEGSFDACSAIAEIRLPIEVGETAAYIGAAIIGATASDRASVKRWITDWNRSCGVQFGITHLGEMRVFMLHPTDAIKAAAPLYTDAYEILENSFGINFRWQDKVNRVPFRADYEHTSGEWKTADVASIDQSITLYGHEITGDVREYPFAPGITMSFHLARLEALVRMHPPRLIQLEATVGPINQTVATSRGDSLGYLDLGDYIRYQHFAAVGYPAEIRLAQVVRHQVQAGKRRVLIEALDCEELIDYDMPDTTGALGSPGAFNNFCADAIEITDVDYALTLDTTEHETDASLDIGSPALLPDPGVAYHAAWWKYTPEANGLLSISTIGSGYDTQIAIFTGTCGSSPIDWTLVGYNDNFDVLTTSYLAVDAAATVEYYIVVYGYGPADGGTLVFQMNFAPD